MSHNQSRFERSDGQLRKSGGRSGHSRGFAGTGGGRSGGGGGAAPSHQLSSASNQPSLSSNRSFKKSGNGQGGQHRIIAASSTSEPFAPTANLKAAQNGAHGQAPSQGSSVTTMLSGPAQGDAPGSRTYRALPKAPLPQSAAGVSDPAAPSTPVKGDGSKPFALQFGTISPGIVNGLQIPPRTTSAPPNLDEQMRDQARREPFRAVPTQPISSDTKPQLPTARKDVIGVKQYTSAESHPHNQVKKEAHQQIPTLPVVSPPNSAAVPISGMSMAMPFQQHIPMQFTGPGPQQMPMTLPIGNAPQVPQQIFVHNLQPQLRPPVMIHQGQNMGFGPQITHQLGPQLGNMGMGLGAPQFAQQQPGNFGGPRKTTVKITHPETREELKLDKRTESYTDGASTGHRPPNNVTSQPQPVASFTNSHYFPQVQAGPSNQPPIFFTPSASVPIGSQPQRFGYPVAQSGQPIPYIHPSLMNTTTGPMKSEPSIITVPSSSSQGLMKPTAAASGPKVSSSVTISMPVSRGEDSKLLKPPGEGTVVLSQRDVQVPVESSFQQSERLSVSSGTAALPVSGGHPSGVASVVSEAIAEATDGKKREPVRRSDLLKDHPKKSSKKEIRSAPQQQQSVESAPITSTNSSSLKITKGGIANVDIKQSVGVLENIPPSLASDVSTTRNSVSVASSSSGVITEGAPKDVQTSSCLHEKHINDGVTEIDDNIARCLDSAECQNGNASTMVESSEKMPEDSEGGKSEVPEVFRVDSSNIKVHQVPTIADASTDVQPAVSVKVEDRKMNNSEKRTVGGAESQLISAEVERELDENDGRQAPISSETENTAPDNKAVPSSLYPVKGELEETSSHDVAAAVSSSSLPEVVVVETLVTSDKTSKFDTNIIDIPNSGSTTSVTSGSRDKVVSESTKAKPGSGKKKKRKEILSKADAAGTSDLYNAYKGPEERQQFASTSETVDSSPAIDGEFPKTDNVNKDVTNEEDGKGKGEVDDWEDAADISTPKLENGKETNEANEHCDGDGSETIGTKKYTKDFLLTIAAQCTNLPVGFFIRSDIADALMSGPAGSSHVFERDHHPSPGRITDRAPGVSRGDRRGASLPNDDRWIKTPIPLHDVRAELGQNFRPGQGFNHGIIRNPRGQPLNLFPIFTGPTQSQVPQVGLMRNNSDADRWGHHNLRGIMPPPQTPMQVMHKADRKYEVGKVSDEEQGKQRQLKAILNKLTPQNFDKLFQQVKDVNIDNRVTLSGVIAQIFGKALMEPTFCEMYANFCFHLSGELPDFVENGEKITFKRLLLNECQEEFERGEREQAEANRVEEEGEVKQSEEEREEKRIKARRRMLGNIRLIGELFKKKMLTERIMHECIKKLLGQYQNQIPDEEDLEALCKLLSTIGDQIDHTKAKEHIDAYFDIMLKLSTNQKLSSRVRFMLRDVIDLRKNRWQQRRKVEGPKKIDEVHRDAAQERQSQSSRLSRGPSMNSSRRGPAADYSSRGSSVLPSPSSFQAGAFRTPAAQTRSFGMQDVRLEAPDRHPLENRILALSQRATDDGPITLGPQGGLARGMSSVRGQSSILSSPSTEAHLRYTSDRLAESSFLQPAVQDRKAYVGNRETKVADSSLGRFAPSNVPAGRMQGASGGNLRTTSAAEPLSEEVLLAKSMSAIREFYSARDEKEVTLCIRELNSPGFYPTMVSLWVNDSFEKKDTERDSLANLLVNLCNSQDSLLSQLQLIQGFETVLSTLEDAVNDVPRVAEFLGCIFVKVILENVVPLGEIGKLLREGGEEPGSLIESGLASDVLGCVLEIIKTEKGDSTFSEILRSSKLRLDDFRPPASMRSKKKLDQFL